MKWGHKGHFRKPTGQREKVPRRMPGIHTGSLLRGIMTACTPSTADQRAQLGHKEAEPGWIAMAWEGWPKSRRFSNNGPQEWLRLPQGWTWVLWRPQRRHSSVMPQPQPLLRSSPASRALRKAGGELGKPRDHFLILPDSRGTLGSHWLRVQFVHISILSPAY